MSLSFNLFLESKKNDTPINKTSIYTSAQKRTGISDSYPKTNYLRFTKNFISRIVRDTIPHSIIQPSNKFKRVFLKHPFHLATSLLSLVLLLNIFIIFYKNGSFINFLKKIIPKKKSHFVLMLSGLFWYFPMSNLTKYHDYTIMYATGFLIYIYFILLKNVKERFDQKKILALSIAIFILSIITKVNVSNHTQNNLPKITEDMNRIVQLAKQNKYKLSIDKNYSQNNNIIGKNVIKSSPYAMCFYIGEMGIYEESNYIISKDKYFENNLTPNNKHVFLFKK